MKLLLIIFSFFSFFISYSQVGIGTTSPDSSTALDIKSVNSGVLFPRLTDAQRDAINNPATGLFIYNTDGNSFQYNFGTPSTPNWVSITSQAQSGTYKIGDTVAGWKYYSVTFDKAYSVIPLIFLTFRQGAGTTSTVSYRSQHFKISDVSTTSFTVGIYSTDTTNDVYIDWLAIPQTQ